MPKLQRLPEPNVYHAYGVYLLQSQHRLIKRLRKEYQPSVHGHKTWNSSFVLMDYLQHRPLKLKSRVLEIGCGWAPGSIFCASRFNAKVTGVDIDPEVFPFMKVLAELNDVKVKPLVSKFQKLDDDLLANQDVVIGSDVCFWDKLVRPLHQLINRSLDQGVERFIITDPGRPTFYELCDLAGKKHNVELNEWYATEPNRFEGEVVEITSR